VVEALVGLVKQQDPRAGEHRQHEVEFLACAAGQGSGQRAMFCG